MEYEFISLDKVGKEAEWLCHFLEDIPMWPQPVLAICIHCDSQSSIGRAYSHMYNSNVTLRPYEVHSTCNCKGTYVHQVPL